MPMDLTQWQKRLEDHFAQLAASRDTDQSPLFALEHGLSTAEFEEITHLLHACLAGNQRLRAFWLVWVVYATEQGYDYDGDEYWETFESRTPLWRERAGRWQLRDWFKKFATTYNGVEPTGPWAEFFSIIAWPITHAILPKYLQLQLVRTLYSLRYNLASLESFEAPRIGTLLAESEWDSTSRFGVFLQQQHLVGRIVLALLATREPATPAPIFDPTLQRLATDLGHARNAGTWLRETRRIVADQFKGTARTTGFTSSPNLLSEVVAPNSESRASSLPKIRPALMLRPSSATTWAAFIEFAGFDSLSRLNAALRTFLRTTRCRIQGTGDTWLPTGWTLAGDPRRLLNEWPNPNKTLLAFEAHNSLLEHLLEADCRLTRGTIWLFRIGADHCAREIVGRFVRCDFEYIIVSQQELRCDISHIAPCSLSCKGVFGYRLAMPKEISEGEITQLDKIGLHVARTIRMWPAGLASREWDGEGHSAWLSTEMPCFAIAHDHPADSYKLHLDSGHELVIPAKAPGAATFVQLPRLTAGRHAITATVQRQSSAIAMRAKTLEGTIVLDVRDPAPWIPGTTSHAGMSLAIDPPNPTLDEFWNEDIDLVLQGPAGHHARCTIHFLTGSGTPFANAEIAVFDFPIGADVWTRKVHEFAKVEKNAWAYAEAASGKLVISGDELGDFSIQLEREVKPVRWVCRRNRDSLLVRLVDESGLDDAATITLCSFNEPLADQIVDPNKLMLGTTCTPPGGLFLVRKGDHNDAVTVSSPQIEGGFQGIAGHVDLGGFDVASIDVKRTLRYLDMWMKARLVGPLAGLRRDRSVRAMCQLLFKKMCGARWANAEDAFLNDPQSKRILDELVESVDRAHGFAIVLQRDHLKSERDFGERLRWFTQIATQFQVCGNEDLVAFALKLAAQPHTALATNTKELDDLLRRISEKTVLLRGARLLALLAVSKRAGGPGSTIARLTCRS